MALVTVTDTGQVFRSPEEVSTFLAQHGIWYRRFEKLQELDSETDEQGILAAFDEPIRKLQREGGYTTADVIDIDADTPGLAEMLARFSEEHWHDEDEVRFIVGGRGVFHIRPRQGAVFRIEVRAGDMINVPQGTWHWFDLCEESSIRAIRLFQNKSGWTPRYTGSGEAARHEPLCFGPSYLPAR